MAPQIQILMATYNGARFLPDQLQSFETQDHANWSLIVSDDGSTDSTVEIVEAFRATQAEGGRSVSVIDGPKQNVAMNFLSLLAGVEGSPDFVAWSDQDDVWLDDHLSRAVDRLSAVPGDQPALYGSATWIVDEDLGNRQQSPRFSHPPGFANALVQSIAGGNTMVLNWAGRQLAQRAAELAMQVGGPFTHDWWLYQLISGAGGVVIRDETPSLLYRQHGDNLFGTNRGVRPALRRLARIVNGDLANWCGQNTTALKAAEALLTPENAALLARFEKLHTLPMMARGSEFRALGLYRQSKAGQIALHLAALMGRL